MRKTPNLVCRIGALNVTLRLRPNIRRVSAGSITPSSHILSHKNSKFNTLLLTLAYCLNTQILLYVKFETLSKEFRYFLMSSLMIYTNNHIGKMLSKSCILHKVINSAVATQYV